MSDILPNQLLNKKRMSVELSGMLLNIQKMELRLMELEDEKTKIAENMEVSQKRITELEGLIKEK